MILGSIVMMLMQKLNHLPAKLTADVRSTKQVGRGPSFHVTWPVRLFRGAIVVPKSALTFYGSHSPHKAQLLICHSVADFCLPGLRSPKT